MPEYSAIGGRTLLGASRSVAHTGTTAKTTLATWTLPANALGTLGQVEVVGIASFTANANGKTIALDINGTTIWTAGVGGSNATVRFLAGFGNAGATNAQVGLSAASGIGQSATMLAAAADTTAATTLTLSCTLAVATDTFRFEHVSGWASFGGA